MSDSSDLRAAVALRIAASYVMPLLCLVFWFGGHIWVVQIAFLLSLPLIIIAVVTGMTFANSIAKHPVLWTLAAMITAIFFGAASAGRAGLLLRA